MSFASLAQPEVEPLIERLAMADELTLLVGAGASMEAGLPSWRQLIERLLETVAARLPDLDVEEREGWVAATIERDDLLGAGAVVGVMSDEDLDRLIPAELYGAAPRRSPPARSPIRWPPFGRSGASGSRSSRPTTTTCSSRR